MNRKHYKDEKVEYAIKSLTNILFYKLYIFYCKMEKITV